MGKGRDEEMGRGGEILLWRKARGEEEREGRGEEERERRRERV